MKALTYTMDSVSTVTFTDLAIDTTYYIGECTADGVNYLRGQTADGTTYTAMFSNGNSVETGSNGGNKAVEFENRFVKFLTRARRAKKVLRMILGVIPIAVAFVFLSNTPEVVGCFLLYFFISTWATLLFPLIGIHSYLFYIV